MTTITLDEQIKALLRKKAQIALLKQVEAYTDKLPDDKDYPGLTPEVQSTFKTFISTIIAGIERPVPTVGAPTPTVPNSSGHLPSESLQAVTTLAKAATPAPNVPMHTPPVVSPLSPDVPRAEKIQFAKDHMRLANRTVTAANAKGDVVQGKVVQLDAPFVILQTDKGMVPVKPSTIQE